MANPETLYATTVDKTERRALRAAVWANHRKHVCAMVRRMIKDPEFWPDAEQAGSLGVLKALEKYDPARITAVGGDRGAAFWCFATLYVRDEIRAFIGTGVDWRKPTNRGVGPDRDAARLQAQAHRHMASLDAPGHRGTVHETVLDCTPSGDAGPEELTGDFEVLSRLGEFAATLSAADRELLFSENHRRTKSRHHLTLVERATAYVRGSDEGGHSIAVRRYSDSVRP